jgi:hypothetical protein
MLTFLKYRVWNVKPIICINNYKLFVYDLNLFKYYAKMLFKVKNVHFVRIDIWSDNTISIVWLIFRDAFN